MRPLFGHHWCQCDDPRVVTCERGLMDTDRISGLRETLPMTVDVAGADVVWWMTSAQASAVAKSIVPREAVDADWLDDMAILLAAAADRRGVFLRPLPSVTAA